MPDQEEIHKKCISEKSEDRQEAIRLLKTHFSNFSDHHQVWKDLHGLTQDNDRYVRRRAAYALEKVFSQVPNKDQACQDLHRLTQDEDYDVRRRAADGLRTIFSQISDKDRAWKDLIRLTKDKDSGVRRSAAYALGTVFSQVSDKDQVWKDLIRLTKDKDRGVRRSSAYALGTVFSQVSDRDRAWQDLRRLTEDEDRGVRRSSAYALGTVFSQIPYKDQGWQDLIRLTQDGDGITREGAAHALGTVFSQVSDKDQVWKDLIRLTQDKDRGVRRSAAYALEKVFSQVSNKDQAWQDLHRITQDGDCGVRRRAAHALGAVFSQVSDKDQAWQDLIRLTQEEDSIVRMYAYNSLGKASVFKATEKADKDAFKNELEAAVAYFEKSSNEREYSPARFCFPFYRSYLAITFQDAKEGEVQRYLAKAKEAIGGSKSKSLLLDAVENLALALQKSKSLKNRPFDEIVNELNAYKWYCEKAADHMAEAEERAPGAVKLLRKCNPLIEERVLTTIKDIQERARQICQITRGSGTELEVPGAEIHRLAKLLSFDDICRTQRSITRIISNLKDFCRLLPEGKKELVCGAVEEIEQAKEFPDKLDKIELAQSYVISSVGIALQLDDVRSNLQQEINKATGLILERLDQNQRVIVQTVLKGLEENGYHDHQFIELLDRLETYVLDLEQKPIEDSALKNDVDKAYSCLKDTELNIKNKLFFTIPLIPIFLNYQGEIELESGLRLSEAWNKLTKGLRL